MYGEQDRAGSGYPTDASAAGGQAYPSGAGQTPASPYTAYQQVYPPTPQVTYQSQTGMQQPLQDSGMQQPLMYSGVSPVMPEMSAQQPPMQSGSIPAMNNSGMQQPYQPANTYPYQVEGRPADYTNAPTKVKPPRREIELEAIVRPFVIFGLPVMMVLFLVCMVLGSILWLKWTFIGFALCMAGIMWLNRKMFQRDMVLTFSVVLGALMLVTAVSVLTTPVPAPTYNITPAPGNTDPAVIGLGGVYGPATTAQETPPLWAEVTPAPATGSATAQDSGLNSVAVERMISFMHYWSVNQTDRMVELCLPSWVESQRNAAKKKGEDTSQAAEKALYGIQANRIPTEYTATAISGTDNDITRTVTTSVLIDRNNGSSIARYIFKIVMTKEDDQWYVDPRSLESNVKATATPVSMEAAQPPTPAPVADPSAVLYYNPSGGTQYHINQNCKSTHSKYLPFKGQFTYGELRNPPYDQLMPCSVCGAPLRPKGQ